MRRDMFNSEGRKVADSKRSAKSVFSKYVVDPAKKVGRYVALPAFLTLAVYAVNANAENKKEKTTQIEKKTKSFKKVKEKCGDDNDCFLKEAENREEAVEGENEVVKEECGKLDEETAKEIYKEIKEKCGDEGCDFRKEWREFDESKKPDCNESMWCKNHDIFVEKTVPESTERVFGAIKEKGLITVINDGLKKCSGEKCKLSVQKGDDILTVESTEEQSGFAELWVKEVDSKGIVLGMYSEVFMGGSTKGYLRLNYDGTAQVIDIYNGKKSDKNAAEAKQLIKEVFSFETLEAKDGKLVVSPKD